MSHPIHRAFRALPVLAIAALLAITTSPAVAAPGDVLTTLPNGCQIIEAPTPTVHTVCHGLTFDSDDMIGGIDWSYADLTGSTITEPLFLAASAADDLVLDDVTYDAWGAPLFYDFGSVTSARNATIAGGIASSWGPPSYVPWAGSTWYGTPLDFTGADLTGLQVPTGGVQGVDFTGADLTGAVFAAGYHAHLILHNANLTGATIISSYGTGGLDLTDATITDFALYTHDTSLPAPTTPGSIGNSTFAGLDMRMMTLSPGVPLNAVDLTDTVWDGMTTSIRHFDGSRLNGASFVDVTFTEGPVRITNEARYADFTGATILDATADSTEDSLLILDGTDALGISLRGADLEQIRARGANLTSADLRDITVTASPDGGFEGSYFNYADLSGSALPLAAATYIGTQAHGTTFTLGGANSPRALFEDADLTGATFGNGTNWPNINGSQFIDSTLDGVTFAATMEGAVILRSSARGASFNAGTTLRMGGLTIADSDLTDSTWPTAANNPADPNKWLYGMKLFRNVLDGSDLDPADVTTIIAADTTAAVTYPLAGAWVNVDGQSPFAADGGYWWGSKITNCSTPSGSDFGIGEWVVNCEVAFDAQVNGTPTTWAAEPFSDTLAGSAGTYGFVIDGYSTTRTNPAITALPGPTATLTDIWASASGDSTTSVHEFFLEAQVFSTDFDQVTFSNPVTFTVTHNAAPLIGATAPALAVGQAVPDELLVDALGFPAPALDLEGLPDGVTECGATPTATSITADLCGTPAAGSGGAHSVAITASNAHGTDARELQLWVTEPTVVVEPEGPLTAGQDFTVSCDVMTPGGGVLLHAPGGDPKELTADTNGTAPATELTATTAGTHEYMCSDTVTGATSSTTITVVLAAGDMADTGARWIGGAAAAAALVGAGVLALWLRRRSA